jgi:hypothetical protein
LERGKGIRLPFVSIFTKTLGVLKFLSLSVVAVALLFSVPVSAQDVVNGSFEGTPVSPNSFSSNFTGSSWTPSNSNVLLISNNFGNLGLTSFGSQYLGFTDPGMATQTVSGFGADQNFVLELYFADLAGSANPQLTVTISGAASASSVFNAPVTGPMGADPIPFVKVAVPFTTTSAGDITIALADTGSADLAVDNVSLSVPEVSPVWAMLLLSGWLGARILRRARRCV